MLDRAGAFFAEGELHPEFALAVHVHVFAHFEELGVREVVSAGAGAGVGAGACETCLEEEEEEEQNCVMCCCEHGRGLEADTGKGYLVRGPSVLV